MNINKLNNTTRPQQRHNKNRCCCVKLQQTKTLLCDCCVRNIQIKRELTPFHNKTTKISHS